jgi:hypothetical protein
MTKRYFPEKFNTVTSADEIGMLFDLTRIPGEKLFEYKKRILESSTKVANSSYTGLINGINRELGLKQEEVVSIDFKKILEGDLSDSAFQFTEYIITDNRSYQGLIDGIEKRFLGNKLIVTDDTWPINYLAGLTLSISNKKFQIISNTANEVILNIDPNDLLIGQTFIINAEYIPNSFVNYSMSLEDDKYLIISNTNKSFTLNKKIAHRVNPKFSLNLNRPRVKVTASRIIFYKDYLNEENYQLDLIIDITDRNLTHRSLCSLVNKESSFFQLTDKRPYKEELPAFTFKQKDSDIRIFDEDVPLSRLFKIKNKNIKQGTLNFSESLVFGKEEDIVDPEVYGPYYAVNYSEGVVSSNLLPNGQGQVSYTYMEFPFQLEHAPASIIDFSDKESEFSLFSQKEKIIYDDFRDRFVSSQPKAEMIGYISKTLSANKQAWGL